MSIQNFEPPFDKCVTCTKCLNSLNASRYVLHEEKPYCLRCYDANFSNTCFACNQLIGTDHKELVYKDRYWHDYCFFCSSCKLNLVDKSFAYKNDRLYCASCYETLQGVKCDGCGTVFKSGQKKYEYEDRQWHEECFKCKECNAFIGANAFVPHEGFPVCIACYEQHYAFKCTKCRKVINKGGVKCSDLPFHRDCFKCDQCDKSLLKEKYTIKESRPFCLHCYADIFAKKCNKCEKPITGKYVSFDDRQWHSDCFSCIQCNCNLVEIGFVTSGREVLCPSCAKR